MAPNGKLPEIICRTLGLSADPAPTLTALAIELDRACRAVAARLPDNPAVRFDMTALKRDRPTRLTQAIA
jgi:hypothetical protein